VNVSNGRELRHMPGESTVHHGRGSHRARIGSGHVPCTYKSIYHFSHPHLLKPRAENDFPNRSTVCRAMTKLGEAILAGQEAVGQRCQGTA
jgi:hypothetical protein